MFNINRAIFTIILFVTAILGCQSRHIEGVGKERNAYSDENTKFAQLADAIVNYRNSIDPDKHEAGVDGYYLENLSPEFLQQKFKQNQVYLAQLELIDSSKLDEQNQINYAIMVSQVRDDVDQYRFNTHFMPLTSEFGFHTALSFMVARSRFDDEQDYALYLKKLSEIPRYFQQNIYWMKKGIATGLTQPAPVLVGYDESISAYLVNDVEESVFYRPFKRKPEQFTDTEFAALQIKAKETIKNNVLPAYQEYLLFFNSEYAPNARENIGISSTPNGEAFYQNRLQFFTTTNMTAEQVHQLGLLEVKRIRLEMQQAIEKTGFSGTFKEFVEFLRTDKQFYATSAEQLLKEASYIAKKADAQMPKFFKVLPRTPYGVAPVPSEIAPKYTTGRYLGASKETEPGYYWVNTYGLDKRPLYVLEALTLHEAVPGHHLQISLSKELKNVPDYRRNYYISAFGEGWGLYAEYLGKEMGFYQNAYSDFGRLTYEMWRAARLVVDTGIHMFGWSRDRAMRFMQDNSALSLHNIKTETDRYISWPGQALSYKIGELTIKRLRDKAEMQLGDEFDIREFHFQVLKNGSLPLNLLEKQIDEYITETQT